MKKVTVISGALIAAFTVTSTIASDLAVDWFVGAGMGYQNDDTSGHGASNGEDLAFELRGGAIIEDHHRVTGTYGYMDKLEQNKFLASYDYLIPVAQNINLFAGVSAGVADSEMNQKSSTDFVWGGQVGAMYVFNDQWSTEVTYRYLDQDFEEKGMEIDNSQQLMLSVDYHF